MFPKLWAYFWCANFICGSCMEYCSQDVCNGSNEHTLCKFQSEDAAHHCVNFEKTIKTEMDRQVILDKLNSRRNKVAAGDIRSLPSAENMIKLEWNEELERSAQRWANQCVKHSVPDIKDVCRDLGKVYVGQNIATIYGDSPGLTASALVDVWYMELMNMNASVLSRYQPSTETGLAHYDYFTQLAWAESSEVGCGGVTFKERVPDSREDKTRTVYRLVCNFAPGGNRLNQSVYSEGIPCSNCDDGFCDYTYKSLCTSKLTTRQYKVTETKHVVTSKTSAPFNVVDSDSDVTPEKDEVKDEDLTPFDYFSHYHQFTRASLSTATKKPISCKDVLAVDDFVELLKSKLSTDPMFKELVQKATSNAPNGVTDATVAALVNLVYSKKIPLTTTKLPENEFVNSTLLVDLVEAVIFRSADKAKVSEIPNLRTELVVNVSPVKIQAELAEVKLNDDFTGHYFFPEDEENTNENESSSAVTDIYYDTENIPVSDVLLELEELKRNKVVTKNFLDEILDSESATEKSQKTNYLDFTQGLWTHLEEDESEVRRRRDINEFFKAGTKSSKEFRSNGMVDDTGYSSNKHDIILKKRLLRSCDKQSKYSELLKSLANDIGKLKLNERFHCLHNKTSNARNQVILVKICIVILFYNTDLLI